MFSNPVLAVGGRFRRIEPLIPRNTRGIPRLHDRRVINGIVHVTRSGSRGRDAEPRYGPRKTIYNRFSRRSRVGVCVRIVVALADTRAMPGAMASDKTRQKALDTAEACAISGDWENPRNSTIHRAYRIAVQERRMSP